MSVQLVEVALLTFVAGNVTGVIATIAAFRSGLKVLESEVAGLRRELEMFVKRFDS